VDDVLAVHEVDGEAQLLEDDRASPLRQDELVSRHPLEQDPPFYHLHNEAHLLLHVESVVELHQARARVALVEGRHHLELVQDSVAVVAPRGVDELGGESASRDAAGALGDHAVAPPAQLLPQVIVL